MAEVISITAALKQEGVPLHAQSVLQMMTWADLVEEVEYRSSTGSGEIKTFHRLTSSGLKYGANLPTLSPTKTELKIFPQSIHSIMRECHRGFSLYLEQQPA